MSALYSQAGRTGSGANQFALSKALAANERDLRYTDYSNERGRMSAATTNAPQLDAGQYSGLAAYLQAAQAAVGIPQGGASNYAGGLSGLLGQYNTVTGKETPSLMQMIGQAAQTAGQVASFASDPSLKANVNHIGTLPDGLRVVEFDYITPPNAEIAPHMPRGRHRGVMADEVAELRPHALGPKIGGFATVDYAKL